MSSEPMYAFESPLDACAKSAAFEDLRDVNGWYRPDAGWAMLPESNLFTHTVGINRTERTIGWVSSVRMGISLPFHSSLEQDWLLLLDVAPEVDRFLPQPPTIVYRLEGKTRHYTADTLVIIDGAPTMVEVKYEDDAVTPDNLTRWPAIRDRFADEGFTFKIVTDRFIRAEPRLSNVHYLHLFRAWEPSPAFAFQIAMALQGGARISLGELANRFSDPLEARQFILGLALRGYLRLDLNQPISLTTLLWLAAATSRV